MGPSWPAAESTSRICARWVRMGRTSPTPATKPGDHGPAATTTWSASIRSPSASSTPTVRSPPSEQRPPGCAGAGARRSGGRPREGQCGLMAVAVAAPYLVGKGGDVVEAGLGPQLTGGQMVDLLDVDAQLPLHRHIGPEGVGVRLAHSHEVTGAAVAGVLAQPVDTAGQDGQGAPGHGGQGANAVVAPHHAARPASAARAHDIAIDHEHVVHPALGQGAGCAQPDHAGPDHHDRCAVPHPGIQSVPASGTLAMAAASTVSAARSSGSRW